MIRITRPICWPLYVLGRKRGQYIGLGLQNYYIIVRRDFCQHVMDFLVYWGMMAMGIWHDGHGYLGDTYRFAYYPMSKQPGLLCVCCLHFME